MEKWIQEQSFEAIYIKKDNGAKTPVATVAVPMGWQNNPKWKAEAHRKANLIAAAPVMLHALEVTQFAISVEDIEAYDVVQAAIKLAKGENI